MIKLAGVWVVFGLIACSGGESPEVAEPDATPAVPGDVPPAPEPDADPLAYHGRVCLLIDMRDPASCDIRAAGLTVRVNGQAAVPVAENGEFSLVLVHPLTDHTEWEVRGGGILQSVMSHESALALAGPGGQMEMRLPTISGARFSEVALASDVVDSGGGVLIYFRDSLGPVTGTVLAMSSRFLRYDQATPTVWGGELSGSFAAVWLPQLPDGRRDGVLSPWVVPPTGQGKTLANLSFVSGFMRILVVDPN